LKIQACPAANLELYNSIIDRPKGPLSRYIFPAKAKALQFRYNRIRLVDYIYFQESYTSRKNPASARHLTETSWGNLALKSSQCRIVARPPAEQPVRRAWKIVQKNGAASFLHGLVLTNNKRLLLKLPEWYMRTNVFKTDKVWPV
jgi:hypothetical protein